MQLIENLQKQWRERPQNRRALGAMSLDGEGLVLGARTVLAKRAHDGALSVAGEELRIFTLLGVAYGAPVDASVMRSIRCASKHARAGEDALAAMDIALAAVPKLRDPDSAAERLFIADGLLAAGVSPRDIWTALEFDVEPFDTLEKYKTGEPRVPAGSGRPSGEWTSGNSSPTQQDLLSTSEREAAELLSDASEFVEVSAPKAIAIAARLAGPLSFLFGVLFPTPAGGKHFEGSIPDYPDLRYSWDADETAFRITRADGEVVLHGRSGPNDTFLGPGDQVIARRVGDEIIVDRESLPFPPWQLNPDGKQPELCPEPPKPDKPGMVGERGKRSKDYEDAMKRVINPERPTPHDFGYQLPNPAVPGTVVNFDDCHHPTGVMIEFKGLGFARQLAQQNFAQFKISLAKKFIDQATRQTNAAAERPIVWFFAEQATQQFARQVFDSAPDKIKVHQIGIRSLAGR